MTRTGTSLSAVMLAGFACISGAAQVATSPLPTAKSDQIAQTVYLFARLNGLYPQTVSAQEGLVQIVLANPTFTKTLEFVVSDGNGKSVFTSSAGASGVVKSRHAAAITLNQGKYTIYVAEHPEWASTLTITPRIK